jgi:hypothetical protein
MIGLQKERFKRVSDGRLQKGHNGLPILAEVIFEVFVLWLPHKHVRAIPRLREAKIFGVDLHVMSTVGNAGLKD